MTRARLLAFAALLACPVSGETHALDEYLQATLLDVSGDRIVLELDLTPGVAVAGQVFALIDRDEDGRVVPPDIADYAQRVVRDLSLRVDGRDYPLTLTLAEAPSWEEIREGEGTIRLKAFAPATLKPGAHRIYYENRHRLTDSDVFLVNVLAPSTRDIAVRAQHRDVLQQSIDVEIDTRAAFGTSAWWLSPITELIALFR